MRIASLFRMFRSCSIRYGSLERGKAKSKELSAFSTVVEKIRLEGTPGSHLIFVPLFNARLTFKLGQVLDACC